MALPQSMIYQRRLRGLAYGLNFIFSLQLASISYYIANFLRDQGLSIEQVSFFFIAMAVFSLVAFMSAPQLFRWLGVGRSLGIAAVWYTACFVVLAASGSAAVQLAALLLSAAPSALLVAALDTIMEQSNTTEQDTGTQRGIFLTMANVAFLAGPLLGGQLVKDGDFQALWFGSVALLLPAVLLIVARLAALPAQGAYQPFHLRHLIRILKTQGAIRHSFISQFLLYFFYSVMVLYTSVYLTEVLGFSYEQLSLTLFVMLLPFVILTVPIGRLADTRWGEKEFMIAGFLIMALATIFFGWYPGSSWIGVTAILLLTRIGATLVATTSESYFFKHVDGNDTEETVAFRALYPLANILGPLFASVVFVFGSYQLLFMLLGVVLLFGVLATLSLQDTR